MTSPQEREDEAAGAARPTGHARTPVRTTAPAPAPAPAPPPEGGGGGGARGLARRSPVLLVIAGSACTSCSATFIKLSGVSSGTAAFLRCALALVALLPMAWAEYRRLGPRPARLLAYDLAAGLLLGVDYVCWTRSIHTLGASIATVLLNVQLVVFPLLARVFAKVRLTRRFAVTAPVLLIGVALAGGALGEAEPGSDPAAGVGYGTAAGVAFAGYLFLIRQGGRGDGGDSADPGDRGDRSTRAPHTVTPVCASTLAAAVSSCVLGSLWTGVDLNPGWPAWGWLIPMALFGQVLAWLLINPALPRLSPSAGATLLLLQPVLALVLGIGVLGERPTLTQYVGCAVIVLVVWQAGRSRPTSRIAARSEKAARTPPPPT